MLKVALTRATKSVYWFGDFEDSNCNIFTMKPNNYHRGLHNLIQTLPQPEPFKIVKDGEEMYIHDNAQLTTSYLNFVIFQIIKVMIIMNNTYSKHTKYFCSILNMILV